MSFITKANGTNGINGKAKAATGETTEAWSILTQYLPSRDPDTDFWWKYSGLHLALMLEEAGYPPEKQLEALVFFYHWGVSQFPPTRGHDRHILKMLTLI